MKKFIAKIVDYVKSLFSFKEDDDVGQLRRYNVLIYLGLVFLLVYMTNFYITSNHKIESQAPTQTIDFSVVYVTNLSPIVTTNHRVIVPTKPSEEFKEGEIVGVKHFGIIGIVKTKIINPVSGNTYEIIYKNNNHQLQTITLDGWLLFHPAKETLTQFSL